MADFESEAIEGDPGHVTVVLKFASKEAATGWFNSREYQAIIGSRTDNSIGIGVLTKAAGDCDVRLVNLNARVRMRKKCMVSVVVDSSAPSQFDNAADARPGTIGRIIRDLGHALPRCHQDLTRAGTGIDPEQCIRDR